MSAPLGVAVLAAGPVTQAIHLPAIAAFPEELTVISVMDPDLDLARSVAAGLPQARATDSLEQALDDQGVDIVLIGSPDRFHAMQAQAACARRVKAVLCEKPLALDLEQAAAIATASRETGVPVLVGTMHAFDPAWRAAVAAWRAAGAHARMIRSTVCLPANEIYTAAATEILTGPLPLPPAPPELSPAEHRLQILVRSVLGLHIHDIPLIRALAGPVDEVLLAEGREPFESRLVLRCGAATVEIFGCLPGAWQPDWRLEAWGDAHELLVRFPPSYVDGGSAHATLTEAEGRGRSWWRPENGYHTEWAHLIDVARGEARPWYELDDAIADLEFALQVCTLSRDAAAVGG